MALPLVTSGQVAGTGSQTVLLGAIQVGDYLSFAWVDSETSTPTSTLPLDNLGNIYTNNIIRSDSATYVFVDGSSVIANAGTPTITIPFPVGKTGAFIAAVFRGDIAFDREVLGGPTNTNSLTATMSGSTTNAVDYMTSRAFSLGTGLTNGEGILVGSVSASNNYSIGMSYRTVSVTGVYSTAWTQTSSTIMGSDLLARSYTPSQPSDPCLQNPMPLLNNMDIFRSDLKLIHISDGSKIQVRSDYALWCCMCAAFVPKSEVAVDTVGFPESFKGVF